ncbi:hypothetical protein Cni_G00612 [Canna indica]|uniref:Uncharacterized protein n=1 Tax=Canna indica TaxID=4628 RepID=A0AAQ3JLK2_9LILI|nr:hypothetical protein Cni_G00612 [Canna indica]
MRQMTISSSSSVMLSESSPEEAESDSEPDCTIDRWWFILRRFVRFPLATTLPPPPNIEYKVNLVFISTPVNAARAAAGARAGVSIDFVELPFPCAAVGLPDGCKNLDLLSSLESHHVELFFSAAALLRDPLKQYLLAQPPSPACMIADACNPWTRFVAGELRMPRLLFYGPSCLYTLCACMIKHHIIWDRYKDDPFEPFDVLGLPHPLRISMARMPWLLTAPGWEGFLEEIVESEAKGKKVWTLGPLSLVHKDSDNKAARGNRVSIVGDEEHRVIRWLDEKPARSVIYLTFGSIVRHDAAQLMEISHGLEAAGRPFLWVIKEAVEASSQEAEKCRLSGFEERTAGRGIIISSINHMDRLMVFYI